MVEPFCSVYTKSYRPFVVEKDIKYKRKCLFYDEFGKGFLPFQDSEEIYDPEKHEELIRKMLRKRLISTYQYSYCSNVRKKSLTINPEDLEEDELMNFFNKFYSKKVQPVPRPLFTSRRVFGYSRFDYYYTGRSEYEDTISREGYYFFKKDYDAGKSRLYSKKQQACQKKKKEEKPVMEVEVYVQPETKPKPSVEKICVVCCPQKATDPCPGTH